MITPLEAFELVQMRTQEHFTGEGGSGIGVVMAELGMDEEQVFAALEPVIYAQLTVNMPLPSQLLGAFVAGALWRSRVGQVTVTDEMVDRAEAPIETALNALSYGAFRVALDQVVREALEAALTPAAGPPTDDGVGGSS